MPRFNKCGICNEDAKYTCGKCSFLFCSVLCSDVHRVKYCVLNVPQENVEPVNTAAARGVRELSEEKVQNISKIIGGSQQIRSQLEDPNLQCILRSIDASPDPLPLFDDAMKNPNFVDFIATVLNSIEPDGDKA